MIILGAEAVFEGALAVFESGLAWAFVGGEAKGNFEG